MTERSGGPGAERQGQVEDPTPMAELALTTLRLVTTDMLVLAEPADPAAETGAPVEADTSVPMSAADYADVRRAVGRGVPNILLGTSTRSLERSFAKLKAVEQGESQSPPEP